MVKINNAIYRVVQRVCQSIAFIPVLISIAMLLFCTVMVSFDFAPVARWLEHYLGIVVVSDADNARTILGTLVGGVISLAVFSFSMVMVVLTRAATTLSPRVIPGLITKKQHQICLGFYLGTIIYSLLVIASIHSENGAPQVPGLAVLFAIVFGITCLAFFVNFIHSITRSIQVDHIVESIFLQTCRELRERTERICECIRAAGGEIPDTRDWHDVHSEHTGYFKRVNSAELLRLLEQNNVALATLVTRGEFVAAGRPLFKLSAEVDEDTCQALLDCFDYYIEDFTNDHFSFGFKLLSEIAVKALSPGINDPGTAIRVLDMLAMLLVEYSGFPGVDVESGEDDHIRIIYRELDFAGQLYECLTPIRHYGVNDVMVQRKLIDACVNIAYAEPGNERVEELTCYLKDTVAQLDPGQFGRLDIEHINSTIAVYCKASGQQVDGIAVRQG